MRINIKSLITSVLCLILMILSSGMVFSGGGRHAEELVSEQSKPGLTINDKDKQTVSQAQQIIIPDKENTYDFYKESLAFNIAILALLVPLSSDIVSRITERYKSDIIIKKFLEEIIFKSQVVVLFINIIYLFIVIFFRLNNFIFLLVSGILLLVSIINLILFIGLFYKYATKWDFILKGLLNDAKTILK